MPPLDDRSWRKAHGMLLGGTLFALDGRNDTLFLEQRTLDYVTGRRAAVLSKNENAHAVVLGQKRELCFQFCSTSGKWTNESSGATTSLLILSGHILKQSFWKHSCSVELSCPQMLGTSPRAMKILEPPDYSI
jgi:hypothetical protein